jgi:hypothetical protein
LVEQSANQSFNSVELAVAARNETLDSEKEIQDEHSGGTARGPQACLRCGGQRALSGSRHGRMLVQNSTHQSGDGAVGCSRLICSGSVPGNRSHLTPSIIGGGKSEVGQRALERSFKEKRGRVVKRLIIHLSSRIFSAEDLPSGFLRLAGRPANQSLNSVE